MAKQPRSKSKAEAKPLKGAAEFIGENPTKEALEKIAAAKAESDKAAAKGDNGGPKVIDEEAWKSASQRTLAEHIEIDKLNEQIAECRGRISSIKKTARAQGVPWHAVQSYVKDQRRIMKGQMGEIVTEERDRGTMHRLNNSPIGTQFGLWDQPVETPQPGEKPRALDPELQGQHAARNLEPIDSNPFTPGSQEFVDWDRGFRNADGAMDRQLSDSATAIAGQA